jgi:hypothetical protein
VSAISNLQNCAISEMQKSGLDDQSAYDGCFYKAKAAQKKWSLDKKSDFFGVFSQNANQIKRDWIRCAPSYGQCWLRRRTKLQTVPGFFHFPGIETRRSYRQKLTFCQLFTRVLYNDFYRDQDPEKNAKIEPWSIENAVGFPQQNAVISANIGSPCNPQTTQKSQLYAGESLMFGELLNSSEVDLKGYKLHWKSPQKKPVPAAFLTLQYDSHLVLRKGLPEDSWDEKDSILWVSGTAAPFEAICKGFFFFFFFFFFFLFLEYRQSHFSLLPNGTLIGFCGSPTFRGKAFWRHEGNQFGKNAVLIVSSEEGNIQIHVKF